MLFLVCSCWYTKKELAKRISILFAAGQMAGAFSGFLGSAIMGGMNGVAGIADWRWLFIIEGVMTIPVAFLTYFVVPDVGPALKNAIYLLSTLDTSLSIADTNKPYNSTQPIPSGSAMKSVFWLCCVLQRKQTRKMTERKFRRSRASNLPLPT